MILWGEGEREGEGGGGTEWVGEEEKTLLLYLLI